jgi:L-alanine-DL-glutamate epimerase-like enolase superfamily enzyme
MTALESSAAAIERISAAAFEIPTETDSEADGTLEWDSTTTVVVEVTAGGETGIGFTYGPAAIALFVEKELVKTLAGQDATEVAGNWHRSISATRNSGNEGLKMMAVAAVDVALWDLKGRLFDAPLITLLDAHKTSVPAYGSGGFCNYTSVQLAEQLASWAEQGMRAVKMKVGRDPASDLKRVATARRAVGDDAGLFVDANGAYDRKEALAWAHRFNEHGVAWFEEPVSSDDLEGLRLIRDGSPPGMEIAAGEYGYNPWYFARMLEAGAVDVLQADVTRCGGVTTMVGLDGTAIAHNMPMSAHTSPTIHAHVCCAMQTVRHIEYFHDHARIEQMLFEGALAPEDGMLTPDKARPGLGIEFKRSDAGSYLTYASKG